jgi:hypothetical protein
LNQIACWIGQPVAADKNLCQLCACVAPIISGSFGSSISPQNYLFFKISKIERLAQACLGLFMAKLSFVPGCSCFAKSCSVSVTLTFEIRLGSVWY